MQPSKQTNPVSLRLEGSQNFILQIYVMFYYVMFINSRYFINSLRRDIRQINRYEIQLQAIDQTVKIANHWGVEFVTFLIVVTLLEPLTK